MTRLCMVLGLAGFLLGNGLLYAQDQAQSTAAEAAAPDRRALYKEGLAAYDRGRYDRAYVLWKPLAENGFAPAQYSLGRLFELGGGSIQSNPFMAALWYRQAAAQDIAAAQNNLAIMYAQGRGVPLNKGRAVELWEQAAANGHLVAKYNLGLSYFNGDGVPEDRAAAIAWFRQAAGDGVADAQYALGQLYREGIALPKDPGLARGWYQKAAAQGHGQAEAAYDAMAEVTPRFEAEEPPMQTAAAAPEELAPEELAGEELPAEERPTAEPLSADDGEAVGNSGGPPAGGGSGEGVAAAAERPASEDGTAEGPALPAPEQVAAFPPASEPTTGTPMASPEAEGTAAAPETETQAPATAATSSASGEEDSPEEDGIAQLIEAKGDDGVLLANDDLPPKPRRKPRNLQLASADPQAAAAVLGSESAGAASARFSVWLATTRNRGEAESFWGRAKSSYPEIFAGVDRIIETVELAGSGANYRLLAGPLASKAVGDDLCRQLRAEQADAFCIPWLD